MTTNFARCSLVSRAGAPGAFQVRRASSACIAARNPTAHHALSNAQCLRNPSLVPTLLVQFPATDAAAFFPISMHAAYHTTIYVVSIIIRWVLST
jgi:hypothetical protein